MQFFYAVHLLCIGHLSHQCVELVADQGAIVDDISFEDDKEEEEPQQHVTEVTEDVVEGAAKDSSDSNTSTSSVSHNPTAVTTLKDTTRTSELPVGGRTGSCRSRCPGFLLH